MLPPPTLLLVCVLIAAAGVGLLYALRRLREVRRQRSQALSPASRAELELPAFSNDSIDRMLAFLPLFEGGGIPPAVASAFDVTVFTSGFALLDGFNWVTWKGGEGRPYIDDPSRLDAADLLTLRKFFTFLSRQDHFCEGFLEHAAAAGVPQRALRRLAALRQAGPTRGRASARPLNVGPLARMGFDATTSWEQFKRDHPPGSEVTGTVTHVAPYGAYVDLGVPFDALLLVPYIAPV